MKDQRDMKFRLIAGLLAVQNPLAYADTANTNRARHRVNLAERAKAVTGLYLFQVEGLIRARVRAREKGIVDVPSMVHMAWLRWLQLHGRQAGNVVPMDGWLVSAFPSELLSVDAELLDRVGQTEAIGRPISAKTGISVPAEFRTPSVAFADSVGMTDFSWEVGILIGVKFGAERAEPTVRNRAHLKDSSAAETADRLFTDLTAGLDGCQLDAPAAYPGH